MLSPRVYQTFAPKRKTVRHAIVLKNCFKKTELFVSDPPPPFQNPYLQQQQNDLFCILGPYDHF